MTKAGPDIDIIPQPAPTKREPSPTAPDTVSEGLFATADSRGRRSSGKRVVAIEPAPASQLRHSLPSPPSAEGATLNVAGHGGERPSLFKRSSRGIALPAPSDDAAEVGAWPAAAIAESVRKEKPLAPLEGWQASVSDAASIPGTRPPAHAPPNEVDDDASHLGPLEAWQLPPPEVPQPSSSPSPRANAAVEEAARVLTGDEPPAPKPSWRERARSASQSIKGAAARAATAAKAAAEARRGEYVAVSNAADEEPSARWQGARRETRETHWDVMHRLQRAEASVRADASLEEVQAMVHTFTEAAEQLEVMGEPDKARDVMEIFLPSFFERADVQLVLQSVGSSTPAPAVPSIAPPSTPPPAPRAERSLAQEYLPMGDAAAAGSAHCSPGSSFDVHVSCTADAHPYTWSGNLKQLHPVDAAAVVFQDAIRNASRRSTGRTTELNERLVQKPEDEEHVTCCCFGGKPAARTRRTARDNSCALSCRRTICVARAFRNLPLYYCLSRACALRQARIYWPPDGVCPPVDSKLVRSELRCSRTRNLGSKLSCLRTTPEV